MNNREAMAKAFLEFNNKHVEILFAEDYFKAGYEAALASQAQQPESRWMSVEDQLPAYGQIVDLSIDGVLQNETYEIDSTDNDLYLTHFWTRDGLEDGLDIEQGQFWRARLPMPLPLPPAPEYQEPDIRAKLAVNMIKYIGATKSQAKAIIDGVFDGEHTINESDLKYQEPTKDE